MKFKRVGIVAIEEVLPHVVMENPTHGKDAVKERPQRIYLDKTVHMDSLRYQCFINSGTKCVACGLEAEYFALEQAYNPKKPIANNRFHLNLYATVDGYREIMFTKDHILARSRGGSNQLNNLQTMCAPCNTAKGNIHDSKIDPGFARTGRTSRSRVKRLKHKCFREMERNKELRQEVYNPSSSFGGDKYLYLKKRFSQLKLRLAALNAIDDSIKDRLKAYRYPNINPDLYDRRMRIHNLRRRVEHEMLKNKITRYQYYQPHTSNGGPEFVAMKKRWTILKRRLELLTRITQATKDKIRKEQRAAQET